MKEGMMAVKILIKQFDAVAKIGVSPKKDEGEAVEGEEDEEEVEKEKNKEASREKTEKKEEEGEEPLSASSGQAKKKRGRPKKS